MPGTFGIIDVGTNSIHLLIGAVGRKGAFRVLVNARELTRLGDEGLASRVLTARAMRRAMGALQRYAKMLRRAGVDRVEAVATSAVREAANGRAFVRRVRERVGLPLRVISGREEARLIGLGVLSGRGARRPSVVIAIGGGSAQVACGAGGRLSYLTSVPLGSARLARRFIRHDPPREQELHALERHVRRGWAPAIRAVRRRRWDRALGSSATIQHLMAAAACRRGAGQPSRRVSRRAMPRLSLRQDALRQLVAWLATSTAAQRRRLPGLDPERQDLALPTGIALLAWMEGCKVQRLESARGSLREGLVVRLRGSGAFQRGKSA